jgi:hypothetical protein
MDSATHKLRERQYMMPGTMENVQQVYFVT